MTNPSSKLTRMRLELKEYDFTVEYLKGKDNFVADALSRITLKELKDMQHKVLKVTTRRQSRQNKNCTVENYELLPRQSHKNVSKPNVHEVITNDEVRKVVTLRITESKC